MRKLCLWFGLLTKRLYKKATFVAILVLIPVMVLGYSAAAQEDSGMLAVALAQKGEDTLAQEMIDRLDDSGQVFRFVRCDSAQEAEDLVRGGKVDAAWIFLEDTQQRLERFVKDPKGDNALVTVLVRQENVVQKLALEKLGGLLYTYCCRLVYLDYVRAQVPGLAHLSDETLLQYYEDTFQSAELFAYDELEGNMPLAQDTHYLTAPVRGLLAVAIFLCGMASALYYTEDRKRGTFGWLSARGRPWAEFGCQMVSLVNVSVVALVARMLAGLTVDMGREVLITLLYCLCVAGTCMLLRRLCGSQRLLATLLPVMVVAALVLCPVFFDIGQMRTLQYLLPPTFYITAAYDGAYLWKMVVHTAITFGAYGLLGAMKKE